MKPMGHLETPETTECATTNSDDLATEINDFGKLVLMELKVLELALLGKLVDLGASLPDGWKGAEIGGAWRSEQ